jgi:hypothetical protein
LTLVFAVTVLALEQHDLGKHSKAEIRKACNAAGGELLGVSDSGAYGCENHAKGTLILCDKNSNCTGWTPLKTPADRKHLLDTIKLPMHPVVATK